MSTQQRPAGTDTPFTVAVDDDRASLERLEAPGLEKSMSKYLIDAIAAASNIAVRLGTQVVGGSGVTALAALTLSHGDGSPPSSTPMRSSSSSVSARTPAGCRPRSSATPTAWW